MTNGSFDLSTGARDVLVSKSSVYGLRLLLHFQNVVGIVVEKQCLRQLDYHIPSKKCNPLEIFDQKQSNVVDTKFSDYNTTIGFLQKFESTRFDIY